MSAALSALGVEAVALDGGGCELRSARRDWLLAVFRAFALRAEASGKHLRVGGADEATLARVVGAALAPDALLFDLDGVLADIAGRVRIADVADVAALAAEHAVGVVTTCPRRLAEAGVKFTTCYFSNSIGGRSKTSGGWDTHGFDDTRMYPIVEAYHLPVTDQTLPTLLEDLEQRGMLDETLVVWMGEFGRTPKINKNASRDHWPNCYSVLLAGGGVKQGYVHGKSDKHASEPAEDAVTPEDLAATIYYLLGINPKAHIHDTQDRPLMISSGEPVMDVIA